jgi:hypothetical protein
MSISAVSRSAPSAADISSFAARIIKKTDTNGDGSVDKQEFVTGLAAKGVSAADAAKQFDSLDTQKTGKLTQSDIESDLKAKGPQGAAPAGARPSGSPPGGGAGKAEGGGGSTSGTSASSSSSSSSTNYDVKDTNKDGTVSAVEALVYEIAHPAASTTSATTAAASPNVGQNVDLQA